LAKPNYAFAKRQKELAKKQKKEEKLKRKAETSREGEQPESDESEDTGLARDNGPAQPADDAGTVQGDSGPGNDRPGQA
jgi:hypothetical protein